MARLAKLIPIISALGMVCSHAGPLADKAAAADSKRESYVEGSDGWRFLPAELRFADKLASPDISALAAPAVTVIADFASQLREGGVSLVVVPIPPKALVQSSSLGLTAEVALQAQRRICRHAAFAVHDFAEPRVRDVQGQRQRSDANLHRLDVVLKQDFPRVNGAHSIFEHDVPLRQSVWVFNHNVKWTARSPFESQSPLPVDPNVPCAVVLLEVVALRCPHEVQ